MKSMYILMLCLKEKQITANNAGLLVYVTQSYIMFTTECCKGATTNKILRIVNTAPREYLYASGGGCLIRSLIHGLVQTDIKKD